MRCCLLNKKTNTVNNIITNNGGTTYPQYQNDKKLVEKATNLMVVVIASATPSAKLAECPGTWYNSRQCPEARPMIHAMHVMQRFILINTVCWAKLLISTIVGSKTLKIGTL